MSAYGVVLPAKVEKRIHSSRSTSFDVCVIWVWLCLCHCLRVSSSAKHSFYDPVQSVNRKLSSGLPPPGDVSQERVSVTTRIDVQWGLSHAILQDPPGAKPF